MDNLKLQLARVFDDNLRTKQWQNYVDYTIIGLILLSTLEVFLSTYEGIVARYGMWLKAVDYFTTGFFSIEVALRIWCADESDPKYKGFWGRVRYCFSFYGLIDILATYTFYLQFFIAIPYLALKSLRIARLLRIFRYLKAFDVLGRAMRSKKQEMMVSLEFLTIVTILLSFILFFVEHEAQPDVYVNGWTSVLWAFAQYIGDPGNFADTPPITVCGRVIACIIGVLGIAIFAVPAGLTASAFSEVMEKDEKAEKDIRNAARIRESMYTHTYLLSNVRFWPKDVYRFNNIKVNLDLMDNEIYQAVRRAPDLRLRDLSNCLDNTQGNKPEQMAVELMYMNRTYGFSSQYKYEDFPELKSNVTLICPEGATDECVSYVTYQTARIGHFNTVINELLSSAAEQPENRCIVRGIYDYQYNNQEDYPKLHQFVDDIRSLVTKREDWVVVISRKAAPKAEGCEHQKINLLISVDEVTDSNTIKDCNSVNNTRKLQEFYADLCASMQKHKIEPSLSFVKYKKTRLARYVREHIGDCPNVIEIELTRDYIVFGDSVENPIISYKTLAEVIHRNFESQNEWNIENWTSAEARQYRSKYIPLHKGE